VRLLPKSLFGRAALLIALTLIVYSVIIWQATMWAVVVPGAATQADLLAMRANQALEARRAGTAFSADVSFARGEPVEAGGSLRGYAYDVYLKRLRTELQRQLLTDEIVITRARVPAQIWVRTAASAPEWIVLTNRVATPVAPVAFTVVMALGALLVLGAAAWWARRLTTPLAQLAREAAGVAEGEPIGAIATSAPSEVLALGQALQSMSQRLAELNEQRELMLAGISHDLRSPLARLRVALELLDGDEASLAPSMVLEIEEMDRMIGQFLHYVRSGYREAPVTAVPDEVIAVALGTLAHDDALSWQGGAATPALLRVEGLRHIVLNLVQNALDYGAPPVAVRTRIREQTLEIEIHDRGSGIDPGDWNRALRPFSRLQAAPNAGHSGLGLALVDRLVRSAGGTIQAQHGGDGFFIGVRLPLG
jgi:two-component system osmolarity sensor histidine kinase EnvZ